jgi:polyphosphate kinase 2 (PPK2 family)
VATAAIRARFKTKPAGALPSDDEYDAELERLQGRLALLSRRKCFERHAVVAAFEGMDAAGKGGAIRRITAALDARQFRVVPISAPTPEELARPYLWRFWFQLPPRGHYTLFDRSWYGRVLVERVRGFAQAPDWQRAYDEINEFERQLAEHRVIVAKFWLAVSRDEQLERFAERDRNPLKRFKVDPEDWANRKHWAAYQRAAQDMVARTDTRHAPWTIVPADDKRRARLAVLRALGDRVEAVIG